jgi:UDP-glucose 4-epimerase
MKNVLITGGAGYIGSHSSVEFLNKNLLIPIF